MKKTIIAAICALFICCIFCSCSKTEEENRDTVSIWYAPDCHVPAEKLVALVNEYNELRSEDYLAVSLRSFESIETLANAFESGRPDLLLCSHDKAFDLYDRGELRDIKAELGNALPQYVQTISQRSPAIGGSFYPLGSQVPLVYVREDVYNPVIFSDFEAFLAEASGYYSTYNCPFFTADSFSQLFYSLLLRLDTEFHADSKTDSRSKNYTYVYNLIANAAYYGGLAPMESRGVELVQSGKLAAAIVASSDLAAAQEEYYCFCPLPEFGGNSVCLANIQGFAVTAREGRSLDSIVSFLSWLFENERLNTLALGSGLVPAAAYTGNTSGGKLESLLLELSDSSDLHTPDYYCDYMKNRYEFEVYIRAALSQLS